MYQPKTGRKCSCRRGIQRDNCPSCESTGWAIDFAAIRAQAQVKLDSGIRKPRYSFEGIAAEIAEWAAGFGYRQGYMLALPAQTEVDGGLACYGR